MGELILLRHGETKWSREGRHTGRTDVPLTPKGSVSAAALEPMLSRRIDDGRLVAVFASPAQRAHGSRRQDRAVLRQRFQQAPAFPGQREQGLQRRSVEPLGAGHHDAEARFRLGHRLGGDRLPERLPLVVDEHDDDRERVPEPVRQVVIV